MLQHKRQPILVATLSALAISTSALAAQTRQGAHVSPVQTFQQGFLHPPDAAKPMVRWWWFGPAVVKPEILRELQQMKADGIGGAELAFVYPEVLDDPEHGLKNLPFLSPEMLDAVRYAQAEGRRLGLRIDVTLCSGWPYGGSNTPLAEAAGHLRTVEVAVPAGTVSVDAPALAEGESFISASLVHGQPKTWDAKSATELMLSPSVIRVKRADTPRVALFFIAGHSKQQVKRAAVDAEGYVLDPFSREAVATHLQKVGEPLVDAFGSTPPYAIFSDSLEAYGADWTPGLPAEFQKRRGYDLLPHMPELIAGGTPDAEKVRHDWGVTLTELVNENYLTQIDDWAKAHHTKFRSQTYGEPAVDFSSQNLVALAEGEGPQWRQFSTLRWATSANHVFGHEVTSGETFTWLHSPVFRATPLDMKAEADIDFIMGENQLIFHGWPYSPPRMPDGTPEVPEPGWSLYAAAVFNDHNPWHPVMPAVNAYITRLSWLMRQGQPANQVAILLPTDDAWASFSPSHVTVTGALKELIKPALMSAILSGGYNTDFIDAKAIDTVGLGTHSVVVLPATNRIPVETMRKLHQFAASGGKVIAIDHLPTMDPEGAASPEIKSLGEAIVLVPDEASLAKALHDLAAPDLRLADADDATRSVVGFIRRKLKGADAYFVTNTSNRPVSLRASFGTEYKNGAQWNPEDGRPVRAISASDEKVDLAPYGSAVYVFSDAPAPHTTVPSSNSTELANLTTDWKLHFVGDNHTAQEQALTDWTADPATLHYSGEVVYSRDVTLRKLPYTPVYLAIEGGTALEGDAHTPAAPHALRPDGTPDPLVTRPGPGMHAVFEPPVREAALVTINGKPAGALWHPPYRLDVSKLLKPGVNHVEIHVFNTALNAWSALPKHDYKPLIAKFGDRFQMQDLNKVTPVSSGILGTIHLVTQETP
jgi:hypothetical protein